MKDRKLTGVITEVDEKTLWCVVKVDGLSDNEAHLRHHNIHIGQFNGSGLKARVGAKCELQFICTSNSQIWHPVRVW